MRGQALLLAGALAFSTLTAAVTPAAAQSLHGQYARQDAWCQQKKQNRMLIGGLLGAAAGAVIGNNLAGGKVQTEGSWLGGAAGAVAGGAAGRATARCGPYQTYYAPQPQIGPGYPQPYYGAQPGYDNYGLAGAPPQPYRRY